MDHYLYFRICQKGFNISIITDFKDNEIVQKLNPKRNVFKSESDIIRDIVNRIDIQSFS